MNDHCRDCIQISNLEKKLMGLEQSIKDLHERISEVERGNAVSEEQIRMIFKILNEIKDSVRQIADKLGHLEQKPARYWDDAARTVVTMAITAIVTVIMANILR